MNETEDDPLVLTIEGADGSRYAVRLKAVFNVDGREYGMFEPIEVLAIEGENTSEGDWTLMEIVRRDGDAFFREIADEKEYERVSARIKEMAQKG